MLRGGVIGLGRMGIAHYAILNPHPDVEFVSAADSSKFMLKTFERYSSLDLYDGYEKMLAKSELDFVIVSTPTASHYEIVRDALARGLHGVCARRAIQVPRETGHHLSLLPRRAPERTRRTASSELRGVACATFVILQERLDSRPLFRARIVEVELKLAHRQQE